MSAEWNEATTPRLGTLTLAIAIGPALLVHQLVVVVGKALVTVQTHPRKFA